MILEFTVKNFRSIEDETFDLTGSNKIKEFNDNVRNLDKSTDVLKSLIIYGRNASGKSNLLNAINLLRVLVCSSSDFKHSQEVLGYEPFTFDLSLVNKPTEFEIVFITKDNLKFKYNIVFNLQKIISEALYYFPKNKPAKLFLREENKPISYGEHYSGSKKAIENDLLPNQLFLSKSAKNNINLLREAYVFFLLEIEIYIFEDNNIDNFLLNTFSKFIFENKDKDFKVNINRLLQASDVNIIDFKIEKYDYNKIKNSEVIPKEIINKIEENPYSIRTYHKSFENENEVQSKTIPLSSESLGTQKLFVIGGLIIRALKNGSIVIIDELDKGLHPLLTKLLIKLFHSKKTNPNNAQLIFASHDSSLLDNELFRRDQIYFTEKDYFGKTSVYRLSDIKGVRKDVPYDKWYLSGRFSAIPIIEDLELKF